MMQKLFITLLILSPAICLSEEKSLPDISGATILSATVNLSKDVRIEFFYDHKRKGATFLCRAAEKKFYKNEAQGFVKIPRNYALCDLNNSHAWVVTQESVNPKSDSLFRTLVGQRIRMAPEAMKPIEPNAPYDLRMTYLLYPKGAESTRFFLETAPESRKYSAIIVNWKKIKIEDAEAQFGYAEPEKSDPKKNKPYDTQYAPN